MVDDSFVTFVTDQLDGLGEITIKRMFSSWGLYAGSVFFAIVSDDRLYFKTNPSTKGRYKGAGMKPFAPSKKQVLKNYMEVPPEVIEDREQLCVWAQEAIDVAET